jgi:hypothetical protein
VSLSNRWFVLAITTTSSSSSILCRLTLLCELCRFSSSLTIFFKRSHHHRSNSRIIDFFIYIVSVIVCIKHF